MAVNRTGAIFKSLTFDGIDSRQYGIYITGEAVFNAPTRRVNLIQIAGRNGLFAQDEGTFDNITITYPAGCYATTEADFAAAISAFRNALCSRVGYKRLEDDYNSDEYRMAVYKDGLEVTPSQLKAGEFTISFECKPQRWLKSGESKIVLPNGSILTNPTLFASSPLFEVVGYGTIGMTSGGVTQSIDVVHMDTGDVILGEPVSAIFRASQAINEVQAIDTSMLNTGDGINIASAIMRYSLVRGIGTTVEATSITNSSGNANAYISGLIFYFDFGELTFAKGTTATKTHTATLNYKVNGSSITKNVTITLTFDGSSSLTVTATTAPTDMGFGVELGEPTGYSTKQNSGTTFIDCETGLCWQDVNGTLASADSYVNLPIELPKLAPNATTGFSKPNTITSLKVTPRWWRV